MGIQQRLVLYEERTFLRFSSSHSTSGSWMKASNTLISVSLLSLRSCIVTSQAIRKTPVNYGLGRARTTAGHRSPSTPVMPNPSMMFCVNLKGTRSGVSSCLPYPTPVRRETQLVYRAMPTFSKRQLKSTWTTSPVVVSSRMFSEWRSPSLCRENAQCVTRGLWVGLLAQG